MARTTPVRWLVLVPMLALLLLLLRGTTCKTGNLHATN
jgi:hypothetical protein